MVALVGTYQNGLVTLDKPISNTNSLKVIVTFLEEEDTKYEKRLNFDDFGFAKSQKNLENYKGSFSDAVIEERRSYL